VITLSLPEELKERLDQAISISVYDVNVNKLTGEYNLEFLPEMKWRPEDDDELIFSRIIEMIEDIEQLVELSMVIGDEIKKGAAKFHHKMEVLEKEVELDLEDITKGYLGFAEYEFAKGVIKDLVEEKYEENMQELHSSIEVK